MDDFSKLSDDELRRIAGIAPDAPVPAPKKPWSASVLPLSDDEQGNTRFDSNAGILGGLKRAFMLPGEVAQGKVDPASPEGIGRVTEMALAVSPANPAVNAGGNFVGSTRLRGAQPAKPSAPSRDALYAASDASYESARNMGVDYSADAVRNMAAGLRQSLEKDGILEELAPKAFSVLKKLEQPPEGSVAPLSGLEAARRAFRNAGKDFNNPTDQLAADRLIRGLDDFMAADNAGSVVSGPAAAAREALTKARGNYAAASRSDRLTGDEGRTVQRAADLRTSAANSGRNLDNTIRQRVADVLLNPRQSAGYSADEIAALEGVVKGTTGRNLARNVGNLLGGGGGLGSVVTAGTAGAAGGMLGGPMGAVAGAAIPAVGIASKSLGNRLTGNALRQADDLVRQRSPLYESIKAGAPNEAISPAQRDILIRLLMQSQTEQRQP